MTDSVKSKNIRSSITVLVFNIWIKGKPSEALIATKFHEIADSV
jgi:hypothetical protein